MSADAAKINAAMAALDYVREGMTVGLGTGSTAAHFVRLLGERVRQGLVVLGVPTSEATRSLAEAAGVPLVDIERVTRIHVAVDGADEIDPNFNLIKGGGGALLREKIIAAAADHFVVIGDDTKPVPALGAFPLPIEVTPFGFSLTARRIFEALRETGCRGHDVTLRAGGEATLPFITDNGNIILDAAAQMIPNPHALAAALKRIPGVVEHGLFLDMARTVIIGREDDALIEEKE
ncbi:MAG: ribose-5-phosphate isomerase RpiA [Hydrogenophilaceae bacterium]|jgi:ribose 5-phosphate isomerase A|nr:ribose-5-phosphate isomerase RpiA [Hydrogenophilaceae bacterium]